MVYNPNAIEPKWQAYWAEHATFRTPNTGDLGFDPKKPKIYILDMFPPGGYLNKSTLGDLFRGFITLASRPELWLGFGLDLIR